MSQITLDPQSRAARNRANARRSTGPRSAAGKAVVSRNATTHGLFSTSPIAQTVEHQADWDLHLAGIFHSLAPVGHLETVLAERVALQLWRQARIARYEAAAVEASQQTFVLETQRHRFHLDACAHSTRADLAQARRDASHAARVLDGVLDAAPDAPVDVDTVLLILDAHVRAAGLADPGAYLNGSRPGQPLADYCRAHAWIGGDLLAALADIAKAAGLVFEDLNAMAARQASGRAASLYDALSDQEIASRQLNETWS
jgi:hypothetical protein